LKQSAIGRNNVPHSSVVLTPRAGHSITPTDEPSSARFIVVKIDGGPVGAAVIELDRSRSRGSKGMLVEYIVVSTLEFNREYR
jgi:hypothetical protein